MTSIYAHFDAPKLFNSAKEEVLFGRGSYTMRATTEQQARIISSRWSMFLLDHEIGLGFLVIPEGNRADVKLSELGREAIIKAGYDLDELEFIGMNSATKGDFLEKFEAKLKELTCPPAN